MKIPFLLFLICVCFAGFTNAQLCGRYTTTLNVLTIDEKVIENATVQLIPLGEDETLGNVFVRDQTDKTKFKITFNEGHQLKNDYKVVVSADSFQREEKTITFPHCKKQTFEYRLIKEATAVVEGTIKIEKVEDGKTKTPIISGAYVVFKGIGGRNYKVESDENGKYKIKLPPGKYYVYATASSGCWMCAEYYNREFSVSENSKIKLDIILRFYGEG